jgi:hypothetical protein
MAYHALDCAGGETIVAAEEDTALSSLTRAVARAVKRVMKRAVAREVVRVIKLTVLGTVAMTTEAVENCCYGRSCGG